MYLSLVLSLKFELKTYKFSNLLQNYVCSEAQLFDIWEFFMDVMMKGP